MRNFECKDVGDTGGKIAQTKRLLQEVRGEISGISHRGVRILIRDAACRVPGWNSNQEGKSLCYVAHDTLFSPIMRKFVA